MSAIETAASSAALQLIDLLVQGLKFLLGELTFAVGFLQRADDAFKVAQDGFEAVTDSVDLAANNAVGGAFAFVPAAAAFTASPPVTITIPIPTTVAGAITAIIAAAATISFATFATTIVATANGFTFANWGTHGNFAIGIGAFFVKFIGFVGFIRHCLGHTFAFGRVVDGWWNIFILVAGTIFTLAKIVVFPAGFFAIWARFCGIIFTRWAVVTTGARWACAGRAATSPSTTAATAAFAEARIAFAWTFGAGRARKSRRRSFGRLSIGIGGIRSGR